jgi:hypothetical protein
MDPGTNPEINPFGSWRVALGNLPIIDRWEKPTIPAFPPKTEGTLNHHEISIRSAANLNQPSFVV